MTTIRRTTTSFLRYKLVYYYCSLDRLPFSIPYTINTNHIIGLTRCNYFEQEPEAEQVHDHQKDSTWSDVTDGAPLEKGVYRFMQLLPPGKVERDRPEDRKVRLDLQLSLLPESSLRRLRQEGPESVTLQLGPPSDSTFYPALASTSEPA